MARMNASNYSNPNYAYATADGDAFDRTDVSSQGQAMDAHDHSIGNGLAVARLAAGAIADASITNAKLGADVARANLLTNGGFEIWQRGNGPFSSVLNGPDRWGVFGAGTDTLSVSKDTANPGSLGLADAVCTFTLGSGAGLSRVYQNIKSTENNLLGATLSFSCWVRTSTPNAVRIGINSQNPADNFVYSSFHSGSGVFEILTVTASPVASATVWQPFISFSASCTAYIDNAMLVVGSVAANYQPLHPADDLARCLRYYQKLKASIRAKAVAANDVYAVPLPFKTTLAVSPTFTMGTPDLTANNAASWPNSQVVTAEGGAFQGIAAAAGDFYWMGPVTLEANP